MANRARRLTEVVQRYKPKKGTKSERTTPKNRKRKPYRGQGRV